MTNTLSGSESNLIGYWRFNEGTGTNSLDRTTNARNAVLLNGPLWVPAGTYNLAGPNLFAEYLLDVELADLVPPFITTCTLPAEGQVSSNLVDRFAVGFSEDLAPSTVTNATAYELRNAGLNGLFGDGDDALYAVANSPAYDRGLTASYLVTDGPLQPGLYRFTVGTALTDKAGNPLATAFIRNFAVANVPGFRFENRDNGSFALATSLSTNRIPAADGSLSAAGSLAVGDACYHMAGGLLNGDTNLDLVTANYNGDSVSVLLGNGDGSFARQTDFACGNGAIAPVLGLFNADARLDLAVANYSANAVSVFLGNGDGTFNRVTNYSVGSQPHYIGAGDFNGDGKRDLATANNASDNISVLLGNGDGTFGPAIAYPAGDAPQGLAVGDVNGDLKLDLVTANYSSDDLSLFLGTGDGSFTPAVNLAAENGPRMVALADLNGDGALDLAAVNAAANSVSVLLGMAMVRSRPA